MKILKSFALLVSALVITDTARAAPEDVQKCNVTRDCTDNPWYVCKIEEDRNVTETGN